MEDVWLINFAHTKYMRVRFIIMNIIIIIYAESGGNKDRFRASSISSDLNKFKCIAPQFIYLNNNAHMKGTKTYINIKKGVCNCMHCVFFTRVLRYYA